MPISLLVIAAIIFVLVGIGGALWDHLGKAHDEIERESLHRH